IGMAVAASQSLPLQGKVAVAVGLAKRSRSEVGRGQFPAVTMACVLSLRRTTSSVFDETMQAFFVKSTFP
ncbi:MAG: hypothetical protein ABS888_02495, partial [Eubacteriales bacterium]